MWIAGVEELGGGTDKYDPIPPPRPKETGGGGVPWQFKVWLAVSGLLCALSVWAWMV